MYLLIHVYTVYHVAGNVGGEEFWPKRKPGHDGELNMEDLKLHAELATPTNVVPYL